MSVGLRLLRYCLLSTCMCLIPIKESDAIPLGFLVSCSCVCANELNRTFKKETFNRPLAAPSSMSTKRRSIAETASLPTPRPNVTMQTTGESTIWLKCISEQSQGRKQVQFSSLVPKSSLSHLLSHSFSPECQRNVQSIHTPTCAI